MNKILDLKRVFSTFQETVWSLLKRGINDFERDNFSCKVDHRKTIRSSILCMRNVLCIVSCVISHPVEILTLAQHKKLTDMKRSNFQRTH